MELGFEVAVEDLAFLVWLGVLFGIQSRVQLGNFLFFSKFGSFSIIWNLCLWVKKLVKAAR